MSKRSPFFLDLAAVTWNTILCEKIEIYVFRLQTRIYKASLKNQYGKMKWLQKKLIQSFQAKLLALKKIIYLNPQENILSSPKYKQKLKKNEIQKNKEIFLSNQQKLILVKYLSIQAINQNLFKSSKKIKFLGTLSSLQSIIKNFFVVQNEAKNYILKFALEAEWESQFSSYSFAFRPGRCSQDLVQLISFFLNKNMCYPCLNFFIGKIKKSSFFFNFFSSKTFNQLKLKFFFVKINTFPKLKKSLEVFFCTNFCSFCLSNRFDLIDISKITFQFFLQNIILQGFDFFIISKIQILLFIYGTTFLSFSLKKLDFQKCKKLFTRFFQISGFIFINFEFFNNFYNFNFLNYTFLKNRKFSFLKNTKKRKKILIFPVKESQKFFLQSIKRYINFFKGKKGKNFLFKIVSKIKNWAFFFRSLDSKKIFSKLDHWFYYQFRSWCIKRHPKWNFYKILLKYFPKKQYYFFEGKYYKNNWVFCIKLINSKTKFNFCYITKFTWILKDKFQKVFATRSPYDGDSFYWIERFFRLKNILL
uniref:Putative reverse transcriptase and intron maturase n=1 Tax=Neglectella solitaria TaxID=120749 RepID=C7BEI9_NEGSO|nr:putative reverse transcriptase and intron maturase [Neglectella solitaria]